VGIFTRFPLGQGAAGETLPRKNRGKRKDFDLPVVRLLFATSENYINEKEGSTKAGVAVFQEGDGGAVDLSEREGW